MLTKKEKVKELYLLYEKPMYYIALAVLKDHQEAEDAVSDSFCKIIVNLDKLKDPKSPQTKSYMIKTVRSCAISAYRKNIQKNQNTAELDENISSNDDCFKRIFADVSQRRLERLLGTLEETDADIIVMHGRDGIPHKEIARRLSMSESNVRKRYERARKTILKNIKEEGAYYE